MTGPPVRMKTPSTLTPGGTSRDQVPELTVKVHRKPWLAIGIGGAVVAAAVVAAVALRPNPPPPVVVPPKPAVKPTSPKPIKRVRVRLESTPAGARVVRVSDSVVLGSTPQTMELRSSTEPLLLRLEKDGFESVTREVSLASDTNLSIVLKAMPTRKPSGGHKVIRHRTEPESETEVDEPAKL